MARSANSAIIYSVGVMPIPDYRMITNLLLSTVLLSSPDGRRRGRRPTRRQRPHDEGQAKWIWAPDCEGPNTYIYARKAFELEQGPRSAVVKIAADSGYRLFVNGVCVGQGMLRGGKGEVSYDTFDVASVLQKGTNAVALLAHFLGENTYNYAVGTPGVICKLEIEDETGSRLIVSDESWKVRRADDWKPQGARISKGLGFQEVYDSACRVDNWAQAGFDDRSWANAQAVAGVGDAAWRELIPRKAPALRERVVLPCAVAGVFNSPARDAVLSVAEVPDVMASLELTPLKKGRVQHPEAFLTDAGQVLVRTPRADVGIAIVLDFGRMVSGFVELRIGASGEGVIDLGYAESLDEGRVKPNRADARYTDRVLLKKGSFCWRSFAPRAFRYLQMEFRRCTRPVAVDAVCLIAQEYPVREVSEFECSDSLLNKVWSAGLSTAHLCMQDAFVDSPRLERAQWCGDARSISRVAYYAFGDTELLAQCLRQFASAQDKDGWIPGLAPSGVERLVPDFAFAWVFSLLDYLAFSSDAELVRELYPNLMRLMQWFGRHVDGDGLLCDVPGEPFIDWVEVDNRGNLTSLNCLYNQALRATAVLAAVLGEETEAENSAAAANSLKIAINKHLFCPSRGLYACGRVDGRIADSFDLHSNILAVVCDVADHYQKSAILRWAAARQYSEIATPYFGSFLLEALYASDRHEEALRYIKDRWGPMVAEGCSTLWEDFAGEGGRCQGWAASPSRDLLAEFVGIKPSIVKGRFSVAPHTGGLSWARGSITTESGRLSVFWRRSRSQLSISVDVPKDVKVDVYPPCSPHARVTLNGTGTASRLLTLGAGSHRIRVVESSASKPVRIPEWDKPASTPHVEVLGTAYKPGRREPASAAARGKARRGRRTPVVDVDTASSETVRQQADAEQEAPAVEDLPGPIESVQSDEGTAEGTVEGTARRGRKRRSGSSRTGARRARAAKKSPDVSEHQSETPSE